MATHLRNAKWGDNRAMGYVRTFFRILNLDTSVGRAETLGNDCARDGGSAQIDFVGDRHIARRSPGAERARFLAVAA